MKNLVTLAAIGVLGFCGYKYYTENIKGGAKADKPEMVTGTARPAQGQAVAISRMIDHWYVELFSDLGVKSPEDLVPPLTVAKERITNARRLVEPAKYPIYDAGTILLGRMIDAAEERTKALEAMLQAAANDKSSLDSKGTIAASKSFFAGATSRRWEDEKKRRKPAIDQLLKQLRAAEDQWNSRLSSSAEIDSYDLASLTSVHITVSPASKKDPNASNMATALYPWRRPYYQQFSAQAKR